MKRERRKKFQQSKGTGRQADRRTLALERQGGGERECGRRVKKENCETKDVYSLQCASDVRDLFDVLSENDGKTLKNGRSANEVSGTKCMDWFGPALEFATDRPMMDYTRVSRIHLPEQWRWIRTRAGITP